MISERTEQEKPPFWSDYKHTGNPVLQAKEGQVIYSLLHFSKHFLQEHDMENSEKQN